MEYIYFMKYIFFHEIYLFHKINIFHISLFNNYAKLRVTYDNTIFVTKCDVYAKVKYMNKNNDRVPT